MAELTSLGDVRHALFRSLGGVAIEYTKAAFGPEVDWANDLDEETRVAIRETARDIVNVIARNVGVNEL